MDTLFKVTHSSNFNTSIQALILVQQLIGVHQDTADRFYRTLYESLLDPRLLTTSKQTLYLNLLFKALRSDLNTKRVKAFIKRLFQVAPMHQAPFACASIYLVRELETVFPDLKHFIDQLEEGESDVEETFRDVPEDRDARIQASTSRQGNDSRVSKSTKLRSAYDGRKRDPQHSNAEKSCFWELVSNDELRETLRRAALYVCSEIVTSADSTSEILPSISLPICHKTRASRDAAPKTRSNLEHAFPLP